MSMGHWRALRPWEGKKKKEKKRKEERERMRDKEVASRAPTVASIRILHDISFLQKF